jgi:hypothetical protein
MGKLISTDVFSSVQVTKEDLIAVALSRHEQELLKRERTLSSRKSIASKEMKQKGQDIERLAQALVASNGDDGMKAVTAAMNAAGFAVKLSLTVDDISSATIKYRSTIVSKEASFAHARAYLSKDISVETSQEISNLISDKESLSQEILTIQSQRIEVKRALSNLGTVERSARAAIAENVLEQSEEGRNLLDKIGSVTGLQNIDLLIEG